MQHEIELRFADIDIEAIRSALKNLSATCVEPMHKMRRAIIDYPDRRLQIGQDGAWGFVRVRDDGKHVAVTYKHVTKSDKETHEIEFDVSSFEKAIELFEAVGLKKHSEQHTRREMWKLDGCDVTIDEWPWIEPIVEIEGPTEAAVRTVATELGFDPTETVHGNAMDIYAMKYPGVGEHEAISEIPLLTFEEMPQWLKDRQTKK